jgi:copper(I)-binding protein
MFVFLGIDFVPSLCSCRLCRRPAVGMKSVDSLEIPPHGKLILEPDGNHLMVMGLEQHPKEGDQVDFTIKLEPAIKSYI